MGEGADGVPGLNADPQWRRILTDPTSGLVRDYGTTRYRPPQALADHVRTRDGRWIEPFCRIGAWHCDLDHLKNSPVGPSPQPHPDGRTSSANIGPECRPGHATQSLPNWTVDSPSEAPSCGPRPPVTSPAPRAAPAATVLRITDSEITDSEDHRPWVIHR